MAHTGGARALLTSGISSVIAEDVVVELAAAVPIVQTQPEKLGAMIVLAVTLDVGKR